jgi:uncharacterized protein with GYD domain
MCYYCHQVSYTSEAWIRVKKNPDDRFEAIRGPIEKLGGQFRAAYFTTGDFDVLAITEFPDDVNPGLIAVAFAGGGEVARIHTVPLLTASQMLEALGKPETPKYSSKHRELALTTAGGR